MPAIRGACSDDMLTHFVVFVLLRLSNESSRCCTVAAVGAGYSVAAAAEEWLTFKSNT